MRRYLQLLGLVAFLAIITNAQNACRTPRQEVGQCIALNRCQSLFNLLRKRPLTIQDRTYLSQSQCGWSGNYPSVCCPDGVPQQPRPTARPAPVSPTTSKLPVPGQGQCGLDTSERIYGGEATKIDEYPWLALLQYSKTNGNPGFHCGGVLIHERYVLTASHCVNSAELPKTWKLTGVRLGEWNLETEEDCDTSGVGSDCADPVQDIPVETLIPHEQYEPAGEQQYNDIALLRLARPAKLSYFVKPICLPSTPELRADTAIQGKKFVVAGWGKTETRSQSDIKLKVGVDGVNKQTCNNVYQSQRRVIGDTQICAGGEKGKDSCRGDSGGPLMGSAQGPRGHFTYLAGLVSYGPSPCGMEGWPGVYTRVASYIDWIESKIY
uniref:CLIP domain-containing serine protease n=1 Tax=Culicoides sonorensis TaxID=179676 RepID=A0A336LMT0_CULSO